MKTLILILSLVSISASAQRTNNVSTNDVPVSTNAVTVVLTGNQDALLKATWLYDTQLRTNGLPPYTNVVPGQTFRQFMEGFGGAAMAVQSEKIAGRREEEMLLLWRKASISKQNTVLRALQ